MTSFSEVKTIAVSGKTSTTPQSTSQRLNAALKRWFKAFWSRVDEAGKTDTSSFKDWL